MKLKFIELFGFKSFAERVRFDLDRGVTAIVGPNGCGKSNVVDAVKWVLGEQRARSLRGNEMTDVIFNGSERRPPMDMAEVKLVFDNAERVLPVDRDEVAIGRRLFRSGESEYLIDGQNVRLKDLRELFMGTGLGPGGYSFMEQGKIDSVLASNPTDRRKVFEEAAGISRFRARRHETELKLDRVDDNLTRLADIVEELTRQENSLKRQAGKARRYREYSQRAAELQAQVALHRFARDSRELESVEASLKSLQERREATDADKTEWMTKGESVGAQLEEKGEALGALRQQMTRLEAQIKGARDLVSLHERNLSNLEGRAADRKREIDALVAEATRTDERIEEVTRDLESLRAALDARRKTLDEREEKVRLLKETSKGLEASLRETEQSFESLSRRSLELEREIARIEAERERWKGEIERAQEAKAEVARRAETLAGSLREKEAEVARLESSRNEADGVLEAARAEKNRCQEKVVEIGDRHREALAGRARLAARVEALESHLGRRDILQDGVRLLLDERASDEGFLPGFRGLLIDGLEVDLNHADAVEAALGETLQAMVVDTVADAVAGARWLDEHGEGRAVFVPLELFTEGAGELPEGVRVTRDAFAPVVSHLLRGIRIVDHEDLAGVLARAGGATELVVTRRGAVVREGGVLATGRASDERGQLALRAELLELRAELSVADQEVPALEEALQESRARAVESARAVAEAEKSSARIARECGETEHALTALRAELGRLQEEESRLARRDAAARERLEKLDVERVNARDALKQVSESLQEVESLRAARGGEREVGIKALDEAQRLLENERVEFARESQRLQGTEESLEHLEERRDRARRTVERYREELSAYAGDRSASEKEAEEQAQLADRLEKELVALKEQVAEAEQSVGVIRRHYDEAVAALQRLDRGLAELSEEIHGLEIRRSELRVGTEALVEKVKEELDLDLQALYRDYEVSEDVDWEAVEAELEEVRQSLRRLGNVNLAAIEDLEEVQERLTFLVAQRDDLLHSKNRLTRILADIEAQSTKLFIETFDRVREHFQGIFRKLFGGGRADIVLVDPENPLESGIEITAKPPGKEARSITLLSGGERTLTAVSLLFAIIRAHPCPCCLLDEVDAALDEDNTERFCMLLDEFLGRTQFVLITHSRRTMARADLLYGVTMGERGVSRRVGVRFEDVGEDGEILEPPKSDASSGNGNPKRGRRRRGGPNDPKKAAPTPSQPLMGDVMVDMAAAGEEDAHGGKLGSIDAGAPPPSRREPASGAPLEKEIEEEA